jgi:hypothetical protein
MAQKSCSSLALLIIAKGRSEKVVLSTKCNFMGMLNVDDSPAHSKDELNFKV